MDPNLKIYTQTDLRKSRGSLVSILNKRADRGGGGRLPAFSKGKGETQTGAFTWADETQRLHLHPAAPA